LSKQIPFDANKILQDQKTLTTFLTEFVHSVEIKGICSLDWTDDGKFSITSLIEDGWKIEISHHCYYAPGWKENKVD